MKIEISNNDAKVIAVKSQSNTFEPLAYTLLFASASFYMIYLLLLDNEDYWLFLLIVAFAAASYSYLADLINTDIITYSKDTLSLQSGPLRRILKKDNLAIMQKDILKFVGESESTTKGGTIYSFSVNLKNDDQEVLLFVNNTEELNHLVSLFEKHRKW